jgi:hypothetical protein
MSELDKYLGIYRDQTGRFRAYGHSNHGAAAIPMIEGMRPTSILDIGCGWNEFAHEWQARGLRAIGVDFACPGADLIGDLVAGLPYAAREWDLLTAFDMLEHLRPDQVGPALREMARISVRFVLSISYADSRNRWKGATLHPTVRPEHWWIEQLRKAGAVGVRKEGRYLVGRWADRLVLAPSTRVILVGNGPGLLAAEHGAAIDEHDYVVRFNNYKIRGYERHVGTRIDLWSTVGTSVENELACPRALLINEGFPVPPGIEETYPLPRAIYDRYRRLAQDRAWLRSGCRIDPAPLLASSGLMAALWFLSEIEVETVTLAGFDHFQKAASQWHHYWIPRAYKRPAEHDGDAEAEIFAELERAGRVRYLR